MKKRVSLIGLGNLLLRDEGIGIHAVRAMEARNLALCGLEIVDGGTAGLDLLPYIEDRDHVLFVDAVNFGKDPGYIGVLENEQIAAMFTWKDSQHHTGLADVLAAAQLLDAAPRDICIIGIQPHIIETGVELSDLLQAKLSLLPALILAKLRDWGVGKGEGRRGKGAFSSCLLRVLRVKGGPAFGHEEHEGGTKSTKRNEG